MEIKKIILECYNRGIKILKENRTTLKILAAELLKKEVLNNEEINKILKEKKSTSKKVTIHRKGNRGRRDVRRTNIDGTQKNARP